MCVSNALVLAQQSPPVLMGVVWDPGEPGGGGQGEFQPGVHDRGRKRKKGKGEQSVAEQEEERLLRDLLVLGGHADAEVDFAGGVHDRGGGGWGQREKEFENERGRGRGTVGDGGGGGGRSRHRGGRGGGRRAQSQSETVDDDYLLSDGGDGYGYVLMGDGDDDGDDGTYTEGDLVILWWLNSLDSRSSSSLLSSIAPSCAHHP